MMVLLGNENKGERGNFPLLLRKWVGLKGKGDGDGIPAFLRFLVEEGIPEEQIASHFHSGNMSPASLEPAFLERVGRDKWLQALADRYQVPAFDLAAADVSPQVALVVPQEIGIANRVASIDVDEDGITLAMVDPEDQYAVAQVEDKTDFKVHRRMVVLAGDLLSFQELLYGTARNLTVSPRDIVDDIIKQAIGEGASDIHIEPLEDEIQVRFRKDGVLIRSFDIRDVAPKKTVIRHLKSALPVVVKNKSGASGKTMNIAENQKPQDGRIYLPSRSIDMRVSVLPTMNGESIVIRIHRPEADNTNLARLGFTGEALRRFESIIQAPYGIILVSGPTGSGKTTTLYTVLRRLNSPEVKILTIEDPVEYNIPGVIQVQVNLAKDLNFASALRSFLRHDPDIVMVGEIRDSDTALMAVEASLTGHLVLSTIHANDAVRTITRIKDLGVKPLLVTSTCLGTMAQRLIRTNCPDCTVPARFSPRFYKLMEYYDIPFRERDLMQGTGCSQCNQTGYKGRTGIHELMVMTPEIRELILRHAPDQDLESLARKQGMRLLIEDALYKAAAGMTTEAEVLRVTLAASAGALEELETIPGLHAIGMPDLHDRGEPGRIARSRATEKRQRQRRRLFARDEVVRARVPLTSRGASIL
ncbi:MAG: type II/IV secretion system protein [Armatimonadetes bacterium]|nr:type II/IV secretion system protein [Armatimonadota bacterium]